MTAGNIVQSDTLGKVRILAMDDDPNCSVWVVPVSDPEADYFVGLASLNAVQQ